MNTRLLSTIGLLALVVIFFAINMLAGVGLRSARVDLTEDHLYTLPAGARSIARSVTEPIKVKLYFSRDLAAGRPDLTSYARRVEDTLREFAASSSGNIEIEIINPEPFTEQEDEAVNAGLVGQPVTMAGDKLYFGMVATNSIDGQEVIPFFDPGEERTLIYDLARRFFTLSNPDRAKVAVMSGLPIAGRPGNQFAQQAPEPAWQIIEAMRQSYDVQFIEPDGTMIGDDVGVLLVVFPRSFSSGAWYAIDQFVMRGGRLIVATDPHCLNYMPPEAMQNQMALYTADRSADLGPLGKAWGVNIESGVVAGDQDSAVSVAAPDRSGRAVSYVVYLMLQDDRISDDDPVTASLGTITCQAGGVVKVADGSTLTAVPLVTTSDQSMEIQVDKVRFPNPDELVRDFVPSGKKLTLAARVSGMLDTAFPDGPPEDAKAEGLEQIKQTDQPAEIVVLGDVDMLADPAWVRPVQIGGVTLGRQAFADNGSLIMNTIENLLGSSDLISIRASAASIRPFTRVQELQRSAEQQFLAERDQIQQELRETEKKINDLLRGQAGDQQLVLTPEIQEQLEQARAKRTEARKRLREVQHKLNEDVDRLDWQMRLINIALVPAAVALFAIGLGVVRATRRRRDRAGLSKGVHA